MSLFLLYFISIAGAFANCLGPVAGLVSDGQYITFDAKGKPVVPDTPIIGFIEGDGIGPEITPVMQRVVDAAVQKAYGGKRKIEWRELLVGGKAQAQLGNNLPESSLAALGQMAVAIKGPMDTPTGKGFRSLNVELRKRFQLYSCERPVRYFTNVPTPLNNAHDVDMKIFRENVEDVYAGVEFQAGGKDTHAVIRAINAVLREQKRPEISEDAGIGIKFMTKEGTQRLARRAYQYAIETNQPSVTIVHKGNIQKFTDGAFREWAYQLAETEFPGKFITEEDLYRNFGGKVPPGKIVLKDRIADNMLQQTILNPEKYKVLVLPNLLGDLLSDQVAALVGGLGIAPGANIGDRGAVFEATHGTAPDIAGQNKANPSSLILSAGMMLNYMGWPEAEAIIEKSLRATLTKKTVTGDFRKLPGANIVGTKEFGEALIGEMTGP